MKQFSIIFLIIILLVGCEQPLKREGVHVAKVATAEPDSVAGIDSATWLQLKAELDYFLERHNVQDEGYEMVARYAANPDSACKPQADGTLCAWNIGHWPGIPRNGLGLEHDSCGHIIIGTYENDTLRTGLRIDPQGNYWGDFADGKPNGHGAYRSTDGAYYEGAWKDGLRHGFGFSVAPGSHVRMGEWKDDRYLGERMHYTSERIYGIDISRYQHEKGRKKFTINWKNLRITHLGSLSQKRISGTVDYPVDFCFIKSTEGVSVRNAYYAKDYLAARKAGISVGAYHFFSTKRTGTAQARYFISNTLFRSGDLPPVLDLEPSTGQIQQMGGPEVLFRQVRAWLQAVERRTGVKPILYVNQTFVNKYLSEAPDLKHDYQVWIARYGEYKPDVKLAFWQLSPDGRVSGIRGEVDINVFNGYRTQFDDFLENESIK